jgi:hypothetical protein
VGKFLFFWCNFGLVCAKLVLLKLKWHWVFSDTKESDDLQLL